MACNIEIQKQVLERLQKLLNTDKELYKNELERISYELKTLEIKNTDQEILDKLNSIDISRIDPEEGLWVMRNGKPNFGNPFYTVEPKNKLAGDMKIANNDKATLAYYKWLKTGEVPNGGDKQALDKRRKVILDNLNMVREAKKLHYSGTAKGKQINHVTALIAISEELDTSKTSDTQDNNTIDIYSNNGTKYDKLSNLNAGPIKIKDITFATIEGLYQYSKAIFAGDTKTADRIKNLQVGWNSKENTWLDKNYTAGVAAQKLGRLVKNLDTKAWDKVAYTKLKQSMALYYKTNKEAQELLLSTGNSKLTHKKANSRWREDFPAILTEIREDLKSKINQITSKGFQGYVGGFENKGKGTPEGDGKDKAMRKVANGFIGELDNLYSDKKSSTRTSLETFEDIDIDTSGAVISGIHNAVVMLARNGALKHKALKRTTKQYIKEAYENGATFVVGDMPGVDSQFIDYLDEIGASYHIYHTENIIRIHKDTGKTSLKSEPSDVTEEGDVTEIVSKQQIWNVDHMNKVLDQLMEKDNIHISDTHKTHIKEVFKQLIDPTLKALPEMSVYLNEKASHNFGEFQVKNGTASIWLGRSDAAQSYGNEMSVTEKFVHELVHGPAYFALNYKTQEMAGTINRLTRLHDAAMELLTIEDLMPDTTINEEIERKIAEDRLEYIGKNLEEFFAYAVTHEKVFNKLKDLEVYTEPKRKEGFMNAVMHYLNKIINFALMKWRKEPKTMRGDMLIMKLFHEVMQANNTAEREIDKTIVDTASEVIDNLEEKWEELLEKVTDKALKKTLKTRPINGIGTENTKWVLANLYQLMFNKDHSGLLELVMTSVGLKPEGFVQTQLRNMKESDNHSQRVQDLQMWSGQVERQREGMAQKIGDMITSQFKKKPTNAQRTAVYKTILKDDGALLIEKYGKKVKDFYSDKVLRDKEITRLDKLLESKSGTKIKLYRARIDDLVNYMQTGKGTLITAKNAFAIASMAGTGAVDLKVSDEITEIIDTLVSLKNIEYNSEGTLDTIVDMLENEFEGIRTTSELQRSLINNKLEESDINDRLNMKKGYVREVYDDAVTSTVAPLKDKKLMLDKGYTEVVELPMIGTIGDETKMALYVSRDMIRQKINRSTMRYTGDKQEGRSLFENQLKGSGKAGIKQVQLIKGKLNAEVSKDIVDILSGKQTKLKSVVTPTYDKKGNIVDYRFNVETEHKMKYLGLETDAIEGVARSYGHEVDVKQSEEVNEAAFNEVVYQMAKDFRGTSIGKSGHEYVMLDENAANPIAKEYTKILPKNVKKLMHELKTIEPDENGMISEEMAKEFVGIGWDKLSVVEKHNVRLELAKGNVWIRRDMLNDVLGVRDISIINAPLVNKLPVQIKTILLKMENFWKQIIQLFKVNIVIKVPEVIIENIISNIMYAVQTGQWPTQIWKTYKEGWDALNIYVDYEKRLNELDALLMKDKSNKKLQIERTRLLDHMKRSPIKPLIDAGLYSHIIEDIDPDAFKSSNRVANWLDNKLEGAPTLIKRGAEWAYVTEKTGLFQLVQGMTAKSDFVARYSQYVFNKDKLIKKEEKRLKRKLSGKEVEKIEQKVLRDVRDTFINYVKPDDPVMQYMNDIGLFLFTKYAIRITRIARNLITKHPIRFSAALLAQETMESTVGYNPSDIVQSSLFTKGVTDWWYSPDIAEVFGQLAMPPLYKDMEAMVKTI